MADRFYCPGATVEGLVFLEGDEARHLARVRRVAVGESVDVFDGRGSAYRAEVRSIVRDRVELAVLGPTESTRAPACSLTLATAVPKGDRFDWLVEKATELGVDRLVPIVSARSTVDPRSAKLDRLRRAIIEAAKQCRRDRLMQLDPPVDWSVLVRSETGSTRLLAHPGGRGIAGSGLRPRAGSAILAIGPEGGFAAEEVDLAVEAGWLVVGLGPTILRVETAALAGCATILAMAESDRDREGVA